MIVVETTNLRLEDNTVVSIHEEHLLERVSTLENKLTRLTSRLEEALDLLLRQARSSYHDHILIDTLISILDQNKTINRQKLDLICRTRYQSESVERKAQETRQLLRSDIISKTRKKERFSKLVNEGFDLLDRNETAKGLAQLEKAAALAGENFPLYFYLGEQYFRLGKLALARDYLERAARAKPAHAAANLLLGLVIGDEGDLKLSRELLQRSINNGVNSFAAHYALGRLKSYEGDWSGALLDFKIALTLRPSAEAHYITATAYFFLKRDKMAARHIEKAINIDSEYAAAYFLLALISQRAEDEKSAGEYFQTAYSLEPDNSRYRSAARNIRSSREVPVPPNPFGSSRAGTRLLTGGDRRLARLLLIDALAASTTRQESQS
jgi:tetratricopeptide (TPR) repeat protein